MTTRLNRRAFLKVGVMAGTGFVLGFHIPWGREVNAQQGSASNPFNAWIRIGQDEKVALIVAKSEMGQGVRTSLPIILADELEVEWSSVRVEQAPTKPEVYPFLGTGGSSSVRELFLPLRQAGAAAREMLIVAAAQTWGVSKESCYAEAGAVFHRPSHRRLAYGELVEAAAKLPVPDFATVPLKKTTDFRYIGKSIPRTDTPSKVDGSAVFGIDVKVPGMVYAAIARCPTFGGKVARFDATKAKTVAGVKGVVEIPPITLGVNSAGGVAVVADSTWAAFQGRDALEIEWNHGPQASQSTENLRQQFESLARKPGKVVRSEGDAAAVLESVVKKVETVYELPFQAHAPMEPMNCTADVRADRAEVWAPTQAPDWALAVVRSITRLPREAITIHTTFMGGGFGRRYQVDFVAEAVQVSKAIGTPVKVVWTREDDMQHDFYRPAAYHRLSGGLDKQGNVTAWQHHILSTSIRAFWDPTAKPESQEITGAVDVPYAIPNIRVEYTNLPARVPVAWWRSVEHSFNAFAVESFVDGLAAAARMDPIQFRLRMLHEPRKVKSAEMVLDTQHLKRVLELVAEKSKWGKPLPKGWGRGVACHFSFFTYVAQVAEVSVDKNGAVRVHRVVCAVDCGQAVNPNGVAAMVEGGVAYGLTAALKGAITIEGGRVRQSNFHDYPMLRLNEMPKIEVHIAPSREAPTGMGEPGVPPIAPAVANALFAAAGKRIRQLPVHAEDFS